MMHRFTQCRLALALLAAVATTPAGSVTAGSAAAAVPSATAETESPKIRDLAVAVDGNLARVSFRLDGALSARFEERLESGLPTGFVYHLELLKDRKRWFDHALGETTLQVVAMYDAATRGYLINYKLDGKLVESRLAREISDLERAMTVVADLPAFELDSLPRSWRLLVRVRAELGSKTIFAFVPARLITDWSESKKFRSLNVLPDTGS